MSTTTLSQKLRDLRTGLFPDIETVNAVLDECIAQAEAQEAQAIGEPVAWMAGCLHDYRMDIITDAWKKDAPSDGNMSKTFTIPLYRSPISPEARDKAITMFEKRKVALDAALKYVTPFNIHKANEDDFLQVCEALSALRK